MRLIRRISLFIILSCMMLALGGYAALRAEQFFYPNRYQREEPSGPAAGQTAAEGELPEQIIEAAANQAPVVTADTVYLVEEVNLTDGTIEETEAGIPAKYIGLDRERLVRELEAYDANPPLTELERGFETIELTAFSQDRVVVCKYYQTEDAEEAPAGYYLMVADHLVVVYREDKRTLYMNTDILLEDLDDALQAQIIQGKYMASEEEVYHFLESYSS